jgi:mannosyltransferase
MTDNPTALGKNGHFRTRRSPDLWTVAVLVAIGGFLRFHAIAAKSFWLDEGISVQIAQLDWHDFALLLGSREGNMSLYYLLLRGWLHFGQSEAFIRSLSVVPALATIPLIYWLGRRLFDRRVGIIAAVLLTFHAYHIRYAQEARGYSLYIFLCALSSAFLLQCLSSPSLRNRLGHIVPGVTAVYAHFFSALLLLSQWAACCLLGKDRVPPGMKRNWGWITILVLPAVIFAGTSQAGQLNWVQRPGWMDLYFFCRNMAGNGRGLLLVYAIACVAAIVPVAGRICRRNQDAKAWEGHWHYLFLLLWLFLPILVAGVLSMFRPLLVARYFAAGLPALLMLAADGLAHLRAKWLLVPSLLVFCVLSVQGTLSYYREDFDLAREDFRGATRYILDHAQPGDRILFPSAVLRMPYEYYRSIYTGAASIPVVLFPSMGGRIVYRDFTAEIGPDLLTAVSGQSAPVWVLLRRLPSSIASEPSIQLLDRIFTKSYPRMERYQFPMLEIRRYSR